jgi:serine/threonine protein kinase
LRDVPIFLGRNRNFKDFESRYEEVRSIGNSGRTTLVIDGMSKELFVARKRKVGKRMPELRNIQKLTHKNIIKVQNLYFSSHSIITITELCSFANLQTQLTHRLKNQPITPYPENLILNCLKQLTHALNHHH